MTSRTSRPALRSVETIVLPDPKHGRLLILRDTQGVTDATAALPPAVVVFFSTLNTFLSTFNSMIGFSPVMVTSLREFSVAARVILPNFLSGASTVICTVIFLVVMPIDSILSLKLPIPVRQHLRFLYSYSTIHRLFYPFAKKYIKRQYPNSIYDQNLNRG